MGFSVTALLQPELNPAIPLSTERLCGNANSNLSFVAFMSKITFIVERIFIGVPNALPKHDNINDTCSPVTKALKNVLGYL
jgi:hypothetical protein